MNRNDLNQRLPEVVDALVKSVVTEPRTNHLNRVLLPNRDTIIDSIKRLRQLVFPGYFGKQGLTTENLPFRIGELLTDLSDMLFEQVRCCLRYREQIPGAHDGEEGTDPAISANGGNGMTVAGGSPGTPDGGPRPTGDGAPCTRANAQACDRQAHDIVAAFFDRIPAVREALAEDVQAAFDGDPAARSTDETIFCYPGLFAIFVQRVAHVFHELEVPLLPRIMTEYAHSLTGIDIHPGAKLGRRFFIDHGTGVVIGETTEIGTNVKIYQGVTLGALAPAFGQLLRGRKRHPTIEDDVTIYAGATILGGETVIGRGAVIGGNVFITSGVPAFMQVSAEPPKLKYRERRAKARAAAVAGGGGAESSPEFIGDFVPDFQI